MFRSNFRFRKERKKEDFCIYDPHTEKGFAPIDRRFKKTIGNKSDDYIGIVSIDPGTVNIGFYIFFFWSNGSITSHTLDRLDFSTADREETSDDIKIYNQAIKKLDEFKEVFPHVHYILIESQLSKNPNAVRMSQHFITYFSLTVKDLGVKPLIIEISPLLKTELLHGPIGKTKDQTKSQAKNGRKKWAVMKAKEILEYNDDPFVELFDKKRAKKGEKKIKKDDIADTICQGCAWLMICSEAEWWNSFVNRGVELKDIFCLIPKE